MRLVHYGAKGAEKHGVLADDGGLRGVGDVPITGMPTGVGCGTNPQEYLEPGDIMAVRIEKPGCQHSVVKARCG